MAELYDTDILLWSEQQAALLRRLAAGERVDDALDFANLIAEVESVGRSEFQAVESLLDVAMAHLLLIHGAVRPEPIPHWRAEALAALARAARRASSSMLPRLDVQDLWSLAREVAAAKLAADGGPAQPFPTRCPFTAAELLNRSPDLDALLAKLRSAAG